MLMPSFKDNPEVYRLTIQVGSGVKAQSFLRHWKARLIYLFHPAYKEEMWLIINYVLNPFALYLGIIFNYLLRISVLESLAEKVEGVFHHCLAKNQLLVPGEQHFRKLLHLDSV